MRFGGLPSVVPLTATPTNASLADDVIAPEPVAMTAAEGRPIVARPESSAWQRVSRLFAAPLLLAVVFQNIANFGFHAVVGRVLPADEYGALGSVLALMVLLSVPLTALQAAASASVSGAWDSRGVRSSLRRTLGAGVLVGIVVAVAAISLIAWLMWGPEPRWNFALTNAVAVLIIACPCALGMATPMAITVGIGRAAKEGILFRDAESLERLGQVNVLFLDKTGTLTEGRPVVTGVFPLSGSTTEEVLTYAASVEQFSEHPLARAVIEAARKSNLNSKPIVDFRAIPGTGVSGRLDGREILVGLHSQNLKVDQAGTAATSAIVSVDGSPIGEIRFSDRVRETARQGLQDLKSLDLQIRILTGDNPEAALSIAKQLGLGSEETFAGLKPADKLVHIQKAKSKKHCVGMAGDGINDAPALSAADVGISLGTGSDIAKQTAGVILVQPDLRGIARAIRLSRLVSKNIRQNILFAFLYNVIGIPIAAGILFPGWGITLNPMIAAAAMSLSSVSVIVNALRLRRVIVEPKS